MSKPKIVEINKTLTSYTNSVMESAIGLQSKAQAQLKDAKQLETVLTARLKEYREKKRLEAAAQAEQQMAEAEAASKPAEAAPAEQRPEQPAAERPAEVQPAAKAEQEQPPARPAEAREAAPETAPQPKPAEPERPAAAKAPEPKEEQPRRQTAPQSAPSGRREDRPQGGRQGDRGGYSAQGRPQGDRFQSRQGDNRGGYQARPQGDRPQSRQGDRAGGRGGYQRPFDKDGDGEQRRQPQKRNDRPRQAAGSFAPPVTKEKSNYDARKRRQDDNNPEKKKRGGIKQMGVFDDGEFPRGSKKVRKKDKSQAPRVMPEPVKIERATIVGDTVSVKLFAEKTGKPVAEILKKLMLLGVMCTINSEIDFDTAALVADEFGITLEQKEEQTAEKDLIAEDREDSAEELEERPPVVTIMGHVDHGKTSLLDRIRKTKVTAGEAGGITQHIGAYTIQLNGRSITFLDTPGHEAFTAMRARGAQVTDVAVLVVAADDGVMPQTIEAINHAKAAGVPVIVAINKIDKEGANPERIKQDLTEYNLVAEEWGGDTIMVPVSAATGEGIENLLEMIILQADMLELKANPNRMAKGTIVEARLDKGRGPVATVLVQNGTLRLHDTIVAGTAYGRVRAMLDEDGKNVKAAGPSQPVEVIGFSEVPAAGDIMYAVEEDRLSRKVVEERKDKIKAEKVKAMSKVSLDALFQKMAEGELKDLNIVVKADVQGSVEAVRQSLEKLSNDEVRVKVIHGGVGAISETDIMLASAANAIIIGFNVRPDAAVVAAAEREGVDIRLYRVIYNAIEDVEKAMKGMLAPEFEERVIGHAEVRQTFKVSSVGTIAGCYVQDGKMVRNAGIRLLRDGIIIHEGKLSSLKRFKDDAKEVAAGYECGMTIEGFNDIKEGDNFEAFEVVEVER